MKTQVQKWSNRLVLRIPIVQKRWLPATRTIVIAHLFAVVVIGLCQFAFTCTQEPMMCFPSPSPWENLCYWVRSGRQRPLADFFNAFDIQRFNATVACVVFLGMGLGWSIWSMRPFRLAHRFRLRTLMLIIAIVPLELTACADVWNRWKRWDHDQQLERFWHPFSSAEADLYLQQDDTVTAEVHDPLVRPPVEGDRMKTRVQSGAR